MPICMMEESGALLIRAVQGHSVKLVQEDELLDILTADQVDLPEQCVHGTYYRHLDIGTKRQPLHQPNWVSTVPGQGGCDRRCQIQARGMALQRQGWVYTSCLSLTHSDTRYTATLAQGCENPSGMGVGVAFRAPRPAYVQVA